MKQISIFFQLCIDHLSKTFAKDVDAFFAELPSSKQAVLQEIFAGMCNCSNLHELRVIWIRVSTILLSQFITNGVHEALKELAVTMVKPFVRDESFEIPEADKIPQIEKCKENEDSIYKERLFYQYFKSATYKEQFKVELGAQNVIYSVEFADMWLKKYLSIACLWTCLTQTARKVNTYVEGHFKTTKEHIAVNSVTMGTPPLKSGRFIRMLLEEMKSQTNAIINEIPSEPLCGF